MTYHSSYPQIQKIFKSNEKLLHSVFVFLLTAGIASGCANSADEYPLIPNLTAPSREAAAQQLKPLEYSGQKIIYSRKFELTQSVDDLIVVYKLELLPRLEQHSWEGVVAVAAAFRHNGKIQRQIGLPLRRFILNNNKLKSENADEFDQKLFSNRFTGRTLFWEYFNGCIEFWVQIEETTPVGIKYYKSRISIPLIDLQ